jgi:prevent-host-death family protein
MPRTPYIRPVSDLRNSFSDISRLVHNTNEPVYLTKNGQGDMVVMSIEAYEKDLFETDIYLSLQTALRQAGETKKRYSKTAVLNQMRKIVDTEKQKCLK